MPHDTLPDRLSGGRQAPLRRGWTRCLLLLWALGLCGRAEALTIDGQHVEEGSWFPLLQRQAGPAPTNVVGGGDIEAIFQAAARLWEAAIGDEWTVRVSYGWGSVPGGTLAQTSVSKRMTEPQRVVSAVIVLDNSGATRWFLDPSPADPSQYEAHHVGFEDLGGGEINTARYWSGGTGPAAHFDLLTTAVHELGHALGLTPFLDAWGEEASGGSLKITDPRPAAGTILPTTSCGHLKLPHTTMRPQAAAGHRVLPTAADILAAAQISRFEQLALPRRPGDITGDGLVGLSDLAILSRHYGASSGANWAMGDFNEDGRVDEHDLELMRTFWTGGSSPPEMSAVVPEPASLALASVSLAWLIRTRRREDMRRRSRVFVALDCGFVRIGRNAAEH